MTDVLRAPFPGADLAAALRPFGESRMLPARAYTSDDVLAWELEHFFARSWTCVGRADDLAAPGTQRAVVAGRGTVLLVRDDAGLLHAFANVCRHRAHELLPAGAGAERGAVVCPYHGWTYTLTGRLRGAPRMREVPSFDPNEHGLAPVPLAEWHGWVFVNASGTASPFGQHVGVLEPIVAPYAPATLVEVAVHDYRVAANWKVVHENYHECYHCPRIHPELCRVSPPASGRNFDLPGAWVGGVMDLAPGATTMSLDGRSDGLPLPGLTPEQRRTVGYVGLLPNLLLSLHPDYVMAHRMEPLSAESCRVTCAWYFPRAAVDRPGFDPSYAVDFWDRTNRQDWAACESVQRGLASPHYRPGPLAPNEDAVYRFVAMVARGYLEAP